MSCPKYSRLEQVAEDRLFEFETQDREEFCRELRNLAILRPSLWALCEQAAWAASDPNWPGVARGIVEAWEVDDRSGKIGRRSFGGGYDAPYPRATLRIVGTHASQSIIGESVLVVPTRVFDGRTGRRRGTG